MNIDPDAPKDKPEIEQMLVIHWALRREVGMLPTIVSGVPIRDAARGGEVDAHAQLVLAFLHEHHAAEDLLLWPILHQRVPLAGSLVQAMEQQHRAVGEMITVVRRALSPGPRTRNQNPPVPSSDSSDDSTSLSKITSFKRKPRSCRSSTTLSRWRNGTSPRPSP